MSDIGSGYIPFANILFITIFGGWIIIQILAALFAVNIVWRIIKKKYLLKDIIVKQKIKNIIKLSLLSGVGLWVTVLALDIIWYKFQNIDRMFLNFAVYLSLSYLPIVFIASFIYIREEIKDYHAYLSDIIRNHKQPGTVL